MRISYLQFMLGPIHNESGYLLIKEHKDHAQSTRDKSDGDHPDGSESKWIDDERAIGASWLQSRDQD